MPDENGRPLAPERGGPPLRAFQGAPGGSATMKPRADFSNTGTGVHAFLLANWHLLVFAVIIGFFVWRAVSTWWLDMRSAAAAGGTTLSAGEIEDKMRAARERQFLAAREAQKVEAERRERQRLEDLAEKERKWREQQAKAAAEGAFEGEGQRLGFNEQLPNLSSGRNYRPSTEWNSNSGGGYRPTGFSRPRRTGG